MQASSKGNRLGQRFIIKHYIGDDAQKPKLSDRKIANLVGCTRKVVKGVREKMRAGKSLEDAPRSGRPPKLTRDDIKSLVAKATGAKLTSSRIIAAELEPSKGSKVSFKAVCQHAKKSGLKFGAPRMVPKMTTKNKAQRVAFGLKHIRNGTDFQKWMFTDSKYFCVSNDRIRCWHKTGEQPAIVHERHAPKVHVYLGTPVSHILGPQSPCLCQEVLNRATSPMLVAMH